MDKQNRNTIMMQHTGLVHTMAQKFSDFVTAAFDYDDMVQVGFEGLAQAVEFFDPNQGYKFSTYSCVAIRRHIMRGIDDCRSNIRIPLKQQEDIRLLNKTKKEFPESDIADLSEKTGLTVKKIVRLETIEGCFIHEYSLDQTHPTESGRVETLGSLIPEVRYVSVETCLNAQDTFAEGVQGLQSFLNMLAQMRISNRALEMFVFKYGIGMDFPYACSNKPVSVQCGVSHQAVSQQIRTVWNKVASSKQPWTENLFLAQIDRLAVLSNYAGQTLGSLHIPRTLALGSRMYNNLESVKERWSSRSYEMHSSKIENAGNLLLANA